MGFFSKLASFVEKKVFCAKVEKVIAEFPIEARLDGAHEYINKYYDIGFTALNAIVKAIKENKSEIAAIAWTLRGAFEELSTLGIDLEAARKTMQHTIVVQEKCYKNMLIEEGLKDESKSIPKPGSICEDCGTDNIHSAVSCVDPKECVYTYVCSKCKKQYTVRHGNKTEEPLPPISATCRCGKTNVYHDARRIDHLTAVYTYICSCGNLYTVRRVSD
jgi:hypothetical protein